MTNPREWALVAFTLLMQTSVGVLLVAGMLQAIASRTPVHGSTRPFEAPLLLATLAGVVALAASFLHLGHPLQAWLAVTNVRTSWLSREVLLGALFVACTAICTLLTRSGTSSPAARALSWVLAAVLGVLVVIAMARLYMVPAQPVWNRVVTPVGFFATTLLLGAVVVLLVGPPVGSTGVDANVPGRALLLLAIALLVIQLVLLPLHVSAFVAEPAPAISAGTAGHAVIWLAAVRALASITAIGLLAIWGGTTPGIPAANGLLLLLLVFGSEVCGRLLFYGASVHLGPV